MIKQTSQALLVVRLDYDQNLKEKDASILKRVKEERKEKKK